MTLKGPTHTPTNVQTHKQNGTNMTEINQDFVSKFYRMNPETDDLIPFGDQLVNGMMVLIESNDFRTRADRPLEDWELERALVNNRWCEVSNLRISPPRHDNPVLVEFIGVYEDGTKAKRAYSYSYSWYVKKDSIQVEKTERYKKIQEIVAIALCTDVPKQDDIDFLAGMTTKHILDVI